MRLRPLLPLVAMLSSSVMVTGCAGTRLLGPQTNLMAIAMSALPGRGSVSATLYPDGTAVVRGWTEDRIGESYVLREVARAPGVLSVVDLVNPFSPFL